MRMSKSRRIDMFSPAAGPLISTPSDVLVATPSSNHAPPRNAFIVDVGSLEIKVGS